MRQSNLNQAFMPTLVAFILTFILAFSSITQAAESSASADSSSDSKPSYETLADVLENPESRQELIDKLRDLQSEKEDDGSKEKSEEEGPSFARQIADQTQEIAQDLVATVSDSFQAVGEIGTQESDRDWSKLIAELTQLAIVIAATGIVFWLVRGIARAAFSKINNWADNETSNPVFRRGLAIGASILLDLLVVILAWVTGYGIALFAIGSGGEIEVTQTLFLNAFLMIEIFKVVLRTVFSAKDSALRPLPMGDQTAIYWYSWLNRLTNFIGYGVLLFVPLTSNLLSTAVAQLLNVLIVLFAFVYAVLTILHNRSHVREQIQTLALDSTFSLTRVGLGMLARSWHLLAIAYFAVMAGTLLLEPKEALPLMLIATVQTVVAIAVGMLLMTILAWYLNRPLHIGENLTNRYPMLEYRLNAFVPKVFQTLRIVTLISVVAVVLDAWHIFNLKDWLVSPAGVHFIATLLTVGAILLTAMIVWIGLASWIEHRLNPQSEDNAPSAREKTLLTIFRNASAITLIIMTIMIVMSEIGINIGPLLAGAGVLGLAIGFGAQKLVQDVITGVFIQMENAISVGDVVTAGSITGVAEKLTIRSLGLRDLSGTYHIIPFSSVDTVSNYMREFAYHVGEYGVAYREDTDEVIIKLRDAFDELMSDDDNRQKILSDELEVHGVTALADSSVNVRVRIKTLPGSQWAIGRAYNRLVKRHLDAAGIEIPFPHLTLYFGEDKQGEAPAAPIRVIEAPKSVSDKKTKASDDARSETNAKQNQDFDDGD
ncbi:mechanosensitive ion channel domain-containing protein [Methylophaga sp. OBS3]|uniref:mechanosensitive ion channel domain-containing protein n=1 Tax=Methylophaga sp. OBS3 TaxID=2991934 RepID=UPI00224D9EE9|nr:mechanosensitive ion channel domain-containing protein [Methylophaga sp. OBS3]MCX4190168.1 mechanosensitive ion channel [Methylophaga sp. OBS3]